MKSSEAHCSKDRPQHKNHYANVRLDHCGQKTRHVNHHSASRLVRLIHNAEYFCKEDAGFGKGRATGPAAGP
ncbi:MAG: hypothetical protein WBO29_11960, partial [Albidovulum sp.]